MATQVQLELAAVLDDARTLVARPDNRFLWTSWRDMADALCELDSLIARLRSGETPANLEVAVIFASTGPMQDLGIDSGWGEQFLEIAAKFDAVAVKLW